jgi:hypothetical protein
MKNIIILLTFLWAITSYAVAPYGIKGQQQAATLYSNVHQFPNNQVTNLGGINALVETGNTNILSNPSFEHSTFSTSWTNSAGTFTQETSVVIDGKASAKLVLAAQTMSLTQSSTLYAAQFADGVQGLAMVRIKSDIALSVCSIQAGTVSTTNCVTTATDSKWGLYKIPFVMGATSQGVSIASSGSVTGTVYVDDCFVGAVDLKVDIDASKIAGESYWPATANCTPTRTSTTIGAFGADADCVGPTIVTNSMGTWETTDANAIRQTVNNLPAGTYKATFYFGHVMTASNNNSFAINDGTTTCAGTAGNGGSAAVDEAVVSCTFVYTSAGSRVFELYGASTGSTISISGSQITPAANPKFQLEYFGNNQVYSSQCGANCVDTFSAKVSSTDVVSDENIEWITGDCTNASSGQATCTFKAGLFTTTPNCTATMAANISGASQSASVFSASSSSISVLTLAGGAANNQPFTLICQKQGADFVATRNIIGSFNEVVTSPGISKPKVCHYAFGGAASTLASPTLCTTGTCVNMKDTCGGMSTAFSSAGIYVLTVPSGTFANDSYITTTSQHGVPANTCGASAYLANASGGATINIRCAIFIGGSDGVATNAHSSFVIQGSAP